MDTTELIKNSLDWADKRLGLKGEKLTEEQRNYITFALRHNLVENMAVTHCCKSDSELLPSKEEMNNRLYALANELKTDDKQTEKIYFESGFKYCQQVIKEHLIK